MAFTNAKVEGTTSGATLYTVPSSTTGIIIGLMLANKTNTAVTASVKLGTWFLLSNVTIPAYTSLSVLDGKIVANASEVVSVVTSANSSVDAVISVLEQVV
jgi:hypothetical protein